MADVSRSLREDPPLPGQPTEGWVGLSVGPSATAGGHAGHAGHAPPGAAPMDHAAMGHGSSPPGVRPDGDATVEGAHGGH